MDTKIDLANLATRDGIVNMFVFFTSGVAKDKKRTVAPSELLVRVP